ncbi:MAG TPA: Ig-like domain-containing protein, partial [Gemmatimonadales bacterium]|nr:Ig-like domain-containing protein [Gemmatimonadales bacterium]
MSHRPASLVLVALLALVGCGRESESDCDTASTAVERVEVRPGTVTLAEGDTTRLQAIAYSCAGRLEGAGPFAWRSGAAGVATVDDAGLVTAVGDGSVRIYAALQGKEGYAVVQSGAVPVAAVTVIPTNATVGFNRSGPLTAIALDGQGRELTGRTTTWSSNDEGGVAVTANGTVTGLRVGARATITARVENQSATSTITVSNVVVSSIEITGSVASLPVGSSFTFDARTADASGNRLESRIIAWSSSDPTVARVSPTGVVTGLRSGAVTITARSEGLSASVPLAVAVGAPARLGFVVQPTTVTAGSPITPSVQVEVLDDRGNRVTASQASVTLSLAANPGGATLSGTLVRSAVEGVATFEGLQLDRSGTGYRLAANAPNLTAATSATFDVTSSGVASLVFVQQPPASAAGVAMSPAPQVEARDALGNRVTTFTQAITLAIDDNPGSGALGGTVTVGAVQGLATFTNVYVSRPGAGYTLLASSGNLAVTSAAFDVTPGPAGRLVFLTQPSTVVAGSALSPAVQVEVQDGLGNRVTSSTAPITIVLGSNPGSATLGGTATVNAVAGVATFGTLSVSAAGTGYTLAASSAGLANATSAAFNVTARPATQLAFSVQPSTAAAGTAIAPPIRVEVRNAIGERVTGSTAPVTLALGANPGGSTLSGTLTVNAIDGVATFSTVSLNRPATGYTLTASSAGLTGTTSTTFDITAGAPGRLVFLAQPSTSAAGVALSPAVQVEIQDALGNRVTSSSAAVTVSLANNPGNSALQGTTVVSASGGVATFTNLSLTAVGTGYTLAATSAGVAGATSSAFNVTPGTPTRLTVLAQPSNVVAGAAITPAVQFEIEDAFGNRATQFNGTVGVALGANPGGATLSGTTSVTASSGVATFGNVRLDRTGTGYTLAASSAGLTGVTTTSFSVTPAAAAALRYVVQPTSTSAGATISPPVQVEVIDAFGNRVSTSGTSVSVALGTNPTGATLNGTTSASTTTGLASFATLSVSAAGSGYTLAATSA